EHTEIRVAYDDAYIYAALRADDDPSGIRANTLYRDRYSGDDVFVVFLDTFNDNETGVSFTINPAGSRRDAATSRDGENPLNADYNTFWDTRTTISDQGWVAEVRIPFSSLRFQDDDGRVVMGMTVSRLIARKNERITFPAFPASANRAYTKPSLARKVVMEGVYARKPLHATPYLLGGVRRSYDAEAGSIVRDGRTDHEAGLDLKYGLTTNLTLDLTVNTDFAQVEADDAQLNLTRFSLLFPEKREFFQERAAIFEFTSGRDTRLFHSRRIGLTAQGEPVRILGGARAIGRIGEWDLGLLDMQTASHGALPSENFGVLRLRRQVFNPYSYAGAMATSRVGMEGTYNLAYGADAVVRLFGDDYLTARWSQTFDRDSLDVERGGLRSGEFTIDAERRREAGVAYVSRFTWSGRDHDPGIGYKRRRDFSLVDQSVAYTWLGSPSSPFIRYAMDAEVEMYLRNEDRSIESLEAGPGWSFTTKDGSMASLEARLIQEDLLADFDLSDEAGVPAGRYTFPQVEATHTMSPRARLRASTSVTAGGFYDGWRGSLTVNPTWNVSSHLELGGAYVYDRVRFPDRNQAFDGHIGRLRIDAALDTRLSARSYVQYSTSSGSATVNLRLRYNVREGNDLWIVYDEGLDTERLDLRPRLPMTERRSLVVKYTYTFRM
ncbi:MAG TPA: DUF5916 domain-containing protein, partial [Longimicrobiaceae bacterium]